MPWKASRRRCGGGHGAEDRDRHRWYMPDPGSRVAHRQRSVNVLRWSTAGAFGSLAHPDSDGMVAREIRARVYLRPSETPWRYEMLRLTLSLIPGGDERRASCLAQAEIVNVGGSGIVATYEIRVVQDHCGLERMLPERVRHDPRDGAGELLRRIFADGATPGG